MKQMTNEIHYRYQICTYDLWGNEQDGYEVNDVYSQGSDFVFAESVVENDRELVKNLKKMLNLKKGLKLSFFDVDGEGNEIIYVNYRGMPICEMRMVEEYKN